MALYSENADELLHPGVEQVTNLQSSVLMVELGDIHMSSALS